MKVNADLDSWKFTPSVNILQSHIIYLTWSPPPQPLLLKELHNYDSAMVLHLEKNEGELIPN